MQIINRKRWLLILAMIIFVTASILGSCATFQQKVYHGIYMKGSILETYDSELYLCIGKKDGATVGQELEVYKIHMRTPPKAAPIFTRENTGKVKITEIIDEHFAKAKVISGKAEKNDIVELATP